MKNILSLFLIIAVAQAETAPVTIGLVTPLTGPRASIGEDARDGARLALSDLQENQLGKVVLALEDSQGDPKAGVSAVQKLLNQGVRFILTQNSNVSLAAQPILNRGGALQMAITTTSDRYSRKDDLSYRTNGDTSGEARRLAEVLRQIPGKHLVTTMDDEYPVALRGHLRALDYRPELDAEFAPNESDFRTILSKAKGFAAVVCLGYQTQCGMLAKQLRALGNTAELFVNVPVNNREFFEVAGTAAEGAVVVYPEPNFEHPAAGRFSKKFGRAVNLFSANAYDGVYLVGQAINQCGSDATPTCVGAKLNALDSYPGLSGPKRMDPLTGDMNDSYSLLVAKDGRFVPVDSM